MNVQPQTAPTTVTVRRHEDMEDEDKDEDEDEDEELEEIEELVTPPARVTEEERIRPGLGCGDADDHSGPPGNPGKKCKHPHDNDGDVAATGLEAIQASPEDRAGPPVDAAGAGPDVDDEDAD